MAFSVPELQGQILVSFRAVIRGWKLGTLMEERLVHPFAVVVTTEYVVVFHGQILMIGVT